MAKQLSIDTSGLTRTLNKAIVATRESASDIVNYASARFVTEVVNLMVIGLGRRKGAGFAKKSLGATGKVSSATATAKREHLEYLRERILDKRLKRGVFSRRSRRDPEYLRSIHLPKKETRRYFATAKRRQGELAAGWNSAALATKAAIPSFVKRHGKVHGSYGKKVTPGGVLANLRWEHHRGMHGDVNSFAQNALDTVVYKLENTKTKLVAANIRRHAAKIRR